MCTNCKLIQVDVDGTEIGRTHPIDVGIVSDVAQALAAFNVEVERAPFETSKAWVEAAMGLKNIPSDAENDPVEVQGRMHPYHAVKKMYQALQPGPIVCIDGGEAGGWSAQLLENARPSLSMVTTGYLGFLGNGWGYALGCAIADPSRQIE